MRLGGRRGGHRAIRCDARSALGFWMLGYIFSAGSFLEGLGLMGDGRVKGSRVLIIAIVRLDHCVLSHVVVFAVGIKTIIISHAALARGVEGRVGAKADSFVGRRRSSHLDDMGCGERGRKWQSRRQRVGVGTRSLCRSASWT